jgi:hypothetical protein
MLVPGSAFAQIASSENAPETLWPTGGPVVLHDQLDSPGLFATSSQNFEPVNDAFDSFCGDDFVVPPATTWAIERIDVDGVYFNGPGPAASINVLIYANGPGDLPGALVYSAGGHAYSAGPNPGDFVINLTSSAVLSSGRYWLVIQPNMNFTPSGQWGWGNRTATFGFPAVWQNPGAGFPTCPSWGRRGADCLIQPTEPDQLFRLTGTMPTSTAASTWGKLKTLYR